MINEDKRTVLIEKINDLLDRKITLDEFIRFIVLEFEKLEKKTEARSKLDGYRQALQDYGLPLDDERMPEYFRDLINKKKEGKDA